MEMATEASIAYKKKMFWAVFRFDTSVLHSVYTVQSLLFKNSIDVGNNTYFFKTVTC